MAGLKSKVRVREDLLENWAALNHGLPELTEKDCLELLSFERENKRRVQFMLRIYGRYNRLRTHREREELFLSK